MLRSFRGNGRKHYATDSARKHHASRHRQICTPAIRYSFLGHVHMPSQAAGRALCRNGPRGQASRAKPGRGLGRDAGRKTIRCIVFPTNPKTATKWRKRETVVDLKTGPQRR